MTEMLFTVPDDWVKPEAPELPALARNLNARLIPPSIRDARSKAVLGVFVYGARQFDFRRLLGRASSEMTVEELPLALYERSLDRYVGPDGLPETVVRELIDHAFVVKGLEGTDQGVELALSLLGIRAEIVHWWQMEPKGLHDTHTITIFVNQHLFEDQETILNERTQRAAQTVIEATKRFSQDTTFQLGVGFDSRLGLGDGARALAMIDPEGAALVPGFEARAGLGSGARAIGFLDVTADSVVPGFESAVGLCLGARGVGLAQLHGDLVA